MFNNNAPHDFLGKIYVLPRIPDELAGLEDLARNLWWAWNPEARALFRLIHPETWIKCDGNPTRFMSTVRQSVLDKAAKDPDVLAAYNSLMEKFQTYMSAKGSWWGQNFTDRKEFLVAYFSMEYGLHESLPIYSGGLGVLAGDHCKSVSDLGLPFVGVGLLYREGYFIQDLDLHGNQQAIYRRYDWRDLPVNEALDSRGNAVKLAVEYPGRQIHARVWKAQIGRIPLYLLDTDIPENSTQDRQLTYRLYGGDQENRIKQEILLGIGGYRALRAMGYSPTVFHMNEGHSVFLGLARMREYMHEQNLSYAEAKEVIRATTLFTTHTPVPAGNDAFTPALMEKYFRQTWESVGLSRPQFMALGLDTMPDGGQLFSLTVLALNLAAMANGVSELHGHVARNMWQHVWPDVPAGENPIRHITNGVHTRTWLSIDMQELLDKYLDVGWRERLDEPEVWQKVDNIPDEELWAVISKLRKDMVHYIHRTLMSHHTRVGDSPGHLREIEGILNPDALTIGFARRFATYKRATLIFRDKERLSRILNHPDRPVQIVLAGKAHPADEPGQALIREVHQICQQPEFHNRVVFLENYDISVGRRLTHGVDLWLNNPRRPYEASGTSGMKVPLNGGLNCSILDGWWIEAFKENPLTGWPLGEELFYDDLDLQDEGDAESIYVTLEQQIVPLFYHRNEKGLPVNWLRRVRESMKTVAPTFSTHRMVKEYANRFYLTGNANHALLTAKHFERAKKNARWKEELRNAWPGIRMKAYLSEDGVGEHTIRVKEKLEVVAEVDLGTIDPNDVQVEIYMAPLNMEKNGTPLDNSGCVPMRPDGKNDEGAYLYRGNLLEGDSGLYGYTVRVVPKHPDLVHPHELGLISWANPDS